MKLETREKKIEYKVWVSCDGQEFNTKNDCERHEADVVSEEIWGMHSVSPRKQVYTDGHIKYLEKMTNAGVPFDDFCGSDSYVWIEATDDVGKQMITNAFYAEPGWVHIGEPVCVSTSSGDDVVGLYEMCKNISKWVKESGVMLHIEPGIMEVRHED